MLKITEIFFSLQGEARDAGKPTVFVRLTGCPLRCTYCDSEYAFYWIPQSQPARQNPVLDVSIREGDAIKRFVVSCFGLTAVLLEVE